MTPAEWSLGDKMYSAHYDMSVIQQACLFSPSEEWFLEIKHGKSKDKVTDHFPCFYPSFPSYHQNINTTVPLRGINSRFFSS